MIAQTGSPLRWHTYNRPNSPPISALDPLKSTCSRSLSTSMSQGEMWFHRIPVWPTTYRAHVRGPRDGLTGGWPLREGHNRVGGDSRSGPGPGGDCRVAVVPGFEHLQPGLGRPLTPAHPLSCLRYHLPMFPLIRWFACLAVGLSGCTGQCRLLASRWRSAAWRIRRERQCGLPVHLRHQRQRERGVLG